MHFWDLDGLVEHLSLEKQTEGESFQYTVGAFLFSAMPFDAVLGTGKKDTSIPTSDIPIAILVFAIAAFLGFLIIRATFRANGGERGRHYLHRILSINFVLGIRFMAAFVPLALIYKFTADPSTGSFPMTLVILIAVILGLIVYYWFALLSALKKVHEACDRKYLSRLADES